MDICLLKGAIMTLGNPTTHLKLLNGMADARGFDMNALRATGAVSDADFSDLMTRCRGCTDPAGCAAALDKGAMPSACANDSRWTLLRELVDM